MEENKKDNGGCKCWACQGSGTMQKCPCAWHGRGKHMLLRVLLALIILIVVFCLGVKLGEFKAAVGGMRHRSFPMRNYMMGAGNYGPGYFTPMMRGGQGGAPQQSTTTPK